MQRPEISASPTFFPELSEGAEEYAKGSAVRALEVDPPFDRYLFIERDPARAAELLDLKKKFPARTPFIDVRQGDATTVLEEWCGAMNWKSNRAVLFLDPFGMDVDWPLLQMIAGTRAMDLWYLFPLFAVNRLLVRGQEPPDAWATRLTATFGTSSWREKFYSAEEEYSLFKRSRGRRARHQDRQYCQHPEFSSRATKIYLRGGVRRDGPRKFKKLPALSSAVCCW